MSLFRASAQKKALQVVRLEYISDFFPQETRIQQLDQEDPLEKGMATHSSILAWRIPWTEEPGGLQPMGS